jgi:IclR family transcriptional regulator, blcABC operon repressor
MIGRLMDERTDGSRRPADGSGAAGSLSPAVTRAVAVLDAVAAAKGAPTGTSELSRRLGLPKSSIANICAALVETGLLRRDDGGFTLGRKLAELGGAYLASTDQVHEFYRICDELPVASEETIQLATLDGIEVTYLARHDGRQPIRLASEIGRRLPASCTATGKAALAALSPDELAERLRGVRWLPAMTARSHRTVQALLDDLDRVRERGFAVDDEETADGVVCFGVAIEGRRATETPYAASVTLLKARATDERRDLLVADLLRLARVVSPFAQAPNTPQRDTVEAPAR